MAIHLLLTITGALGCLTASIHALAAIKHDPPEWLAGVYLATMSACFGLGGWAGWDVATLLIGPV